MTSIRPVFYVSDGTGITAETIGHTVLTQFSGTRFVTGEPHSAISVRWVGNRRSRAASGATVALIPFGQRQ